MHTQYKLGRSDPISGRTTSWYAGGAEAEEQKQSRNIIIMPQGKAGRTRGRGRQSNREVKENEKHSRRRMRSVEGEAKELKHIMRRRIRYSENARINRNIRVSVQL